MARFRGDGVFFGVYFRAIKRVKRVQCIQREDGAVVSVPERKCLLGVHQSHRARW